MAQDVCGAHPQAGDARETKPQPDRILSGDDFWESMQLVVYRGRRVYLEIGLNLGSNDGPTCYGSSVARAM